MVKMPITQGMPPIDPAFVRVPLGCYVMITLDTDGKPAAIRAVGQGSTVDVILDRVQLKSFAEQVLRALER